MSDSRRAHVDQQIALLRHLSERLRDINLQAARTERERLERRLVQLREERRTLERGSPGETLRSLGRS